MKKFQKCAFALVVLGFLSMVSCNSNENQKNAGAQPNDQAVGSHAIINGKPKTDYLASGVVYVDLDGGVCSGTLIHPQWVLTAAHCVANTSKEEPKPDIDKSKVRIGVGNDVEDDDMKMFDVEEIHFHDKYGMTLNDIYDGHSNDIALIKLAQPIAESVAYPIAPLTPEAAINRARIENGEVNVEFIGFGYNEEGEICRKLSFKSKPTSYCGADDNDNISGCSYGIVEVTGCHPYYYENCTWNYEFNLNLQFGSIYYDTSKGGTCAGDSGGPSFTDIGVFFPGLAVASVNSWGDRWCARIDVQTAVQDFYESFILKYAPEVKTYHEARTEKANSELESGECGELLHALCDSINGTKDSTCLVNEDKTWSCGQGRPNVIVPDPEPEPIEEPDPADIDPTSCKTYEKTYVNNGEKGCYNQWLLATCENGHWVDLNVCGTDVNAESNCSENQCKIKCISGFEVYEGHKRTVCARKDSLAGESCEINSMKKLSDDPEDYTFRDGEYICFDNEELRRCIRGELASTGVYHCNCNGGTKTELHCDLVPCELNGNLYESKGLTDGLIHKCIDDNTVAYCFDSEWINPITCKNGCRDDKCIGDEN